MRVGVLGSGIVGQTLAAGFLTHGHQVLIGTRDPKAEDFLEWVRRNPGAKSGTFAEAAQFGELLVLAVLGRVIVDVIKVAGSHNFRGKVLIDINNPIADTPPIDGVLQYFTERNHSLAERLQQLLPDTKVVKAFNSVGAARRFLAPTGRFSAGANTNVGSGYWTSVAASGETIYLNQSKATALSAFQMYEFHGTQQGTMVHPGQTFNLDYSLTHTFALQPGSRLQLGLVGYGQWQTTDKHGPTVTPPQAAAHYKVNALDFAANALLHEQKASIGLKYFREFECRSTFQGYTLQISAAIAF